MSEVNKVCDPPLHQLPPDGQPPGELLKRAGHGIVWPAELREKLKGPPSLGKVEIDTYLLDWLVERADQMAFLISLQLSPAYNDMAEELEREYDRWAAGPSIPHCTDGAIRLVRKVGVAILVLTPGDES